MVADVLPTRWTFHLASKTRKDVLGKAYVVFAKFAKKDLKSPIVTRELHKLVRVGLEYLAKEAKPRPLKSLVPGKKYWAFELVTQPTKLSRPINADLFDSAATEKWLPTLGTEKFGALPRGVREKVLYTAAMSFCCANDLIRRDDRKTPGSFFEYFIGHLVAQSLGVNPTNQIEVLNLDMKARLPTDLIFDLGPDKNKIHLPVKLSTRERVIQVWAHQRVLDGVYGTNRFKGVLVSLTETNLKRESGEVVEICLPDQWKIYQMFIAQLTRIYYLDPPTIYGKLGKTYPFINVTSFAEFFDEEATLISGEVDV